MTVIYPIGEQYTTSAVQVNNYKLVAMPDNATGIATRETTTVVYEYKEIENLKVHYYNIRNWNSINMFVYTKEGSSVKMLTGNWPGVTITEEGDEWYYKELDCENANLFFNYNNDRDPSGETDGYDVSGEVWIIGGTIFSSGKVKVIYLDTEGNILAKETLTEMDNNENTYYTEAKEFDGYTLIATPDNASGVYTAGTTVVRYIYQADELEASVSDKEVKLGSKVSVNFNAKGGKGSYQYAVQYKKKTDKKWMTAKSFSDTEGAEITPAMVADYQVCVKVKDAAGTIKKKYLNFMTYLGLNNTSELEKENIELGDQLTVNWSSEGGEGTCLYSVQYKKVTDTKWLTAKTMSDTSTVSITPNMARDYIVCVKVKDDRGIIVKKYMNFTVTK